MKRILFKISLIINICILFFCASAILRTHTTEYASAASLSLSDIHFFKDGEEITNLTNGSITITALIENEIGEENTDIILALYDREGYLKKISLKKVPIKYGAQTISVNEEVTDVQEGDTLRLFVFNSIRTLIPAINKKNEPVSITAYEVEEKEIFFDDFENGTNKWCRADDGYFNFDVSNGRLISTDTYSNTKAKIADVVFGRFTLDFDVTADFSNDGSYFRVELWNNGRSEWIIFRRDRVSFYNGQSESVIGTAVINSGMEYNIRLKCYGSRCDVYLKYKDITTYIGSAQNISITSERNIVFGQNKLNLNIDNVSVKAPDIGLDYTYPMDNEFGVPNDAEVMMHFNTDILMQTVNPCSIIVYGGSGMPIYSIKADDSRSYRIIFSSPLEAGEIYTVRIADDAVKDIYGQSVESREFSFKVRNADENVYIKNTMPYDGEKDVDIGTSITLEFSSGIDELLKDAVEISNDVDFELVRLNGKKYIIRFLQTLKPKSTYHITISADKINGMEDDFSFEFTTSVGTIRAGAIYFNGWSETRHETSQFNGTLIKSYPEREPEWGYDNDTKEYMEKEIAAAAENGLDYFSFLFYPSDDTNNYGNYRVNPLNKCFENYFSAGNRNMLEWCIYFANHDSFRRDTEGWKEVIDYLFDQGWFEEDMYLKSDGKPVVIVFDKDNFNAEVRDYLRVKMREAGFEDCVLIARGTSGGDGWDGHTQYNIQNGYGECTQEQMRRDNLNYLETASESDKIIAFAGNGWDKRAWEYPTTRYYIGRDSEQFCLNLKSVREWMLSNSEKCVSDLLLINAWNEMGEGGYLIPTVSEGENHVRAVNKALYNEDYVKSPMKFVMFPNSVAEAEYMGMGSVCNVSSDGKRVICAGNQTGAVWGTFGGEDGQYTVKVKFSGISDDNTTGLYIEGGFIGPLSGGSDGQDVVKTYNVKINRYDIIKVIINDSIKIDSVEILKG